MKYIYKPLIGIMLALMISACANNWLDLDPSNGVDVEKGIISSGDLTSARAAMYRALKGTSNLKDYYAARMFYYGDVRGEDMQSDVSGSRSQSCYDMTYSTADGAPSIWQTPYIVIGRANLLIEAAESGKLTDYESKKDLIEQYAAEAKVIRALAHFDLARVYGNTYTMDNGASFGVPVVTEPLAPGAQLARETVSKVYEQVLKDLNASIDSNALLTKNIPGYINAWAAKAILSRVYLTQGNNAKALEIAEDIIKNSPYKLWENEEYVGAWSKSNAAHTKEILLELLITDSSDWTDREGIAYLYSESGYADIVATKSFLDMLNEDPDDVRIDIFLAASKEENIKKYGSNRVFLNKFPAEGGEVRYNNVPLLRLSEVYLNAAEAAFRENDKRKAAKYLDAIVNRANPDNNITETEVTLGKILIERRKELIGEGHRFFDAMRNNEKVVRYTSEEDKGWHKSLQAASQSFDRTFFKTLLPIPQAEINANPAMEEQQNAGY